MNITLIHPYTKRRTFCPPLGILYLAGAMREASYDVTVFDLDVDKITDDELLKHIQDTKSLFVGITCNIVQTSEVFRLAKLISQLDIPIVVGGPMPTTVPEKIMECNDIDICVVGEGERTIVELAEAIRNGFDLSGIKGIVYRENGGLRKTDKREFISDLDSIPLPAHDLNGDISRYVANPTPAPEAPLAAVLPSRGCPFNCNFCSNMWRGSNRKRSVKNVIDELSWLINDFGVKQVFFYDDSFNSDPEYVKELCGAIIDSGLKFGWRADCRANSKLLDKEMLQLMKKSGCWLLAFGVETGNEKIMKNLRKGLKLEDVVKARELCAEVGILFRSFCMIGCIGEDYGTAFDTIDFARRLNPDDPQFSIFTPIIGTEAYEIARERGWISDQNWDNYDSFHATMSTDRLTARETQILHDLATLVVPQWWKPSYEGKKVIVPDVSAEMKKKYGREGEMVTEMWEIYKRNGRMESPVIILNPPSPPGVTSGKDTMGGFGQTFKGEYAEVVPSVDMAYLAGKLRADGIKVLCIDAVGSRLDAEHTLKLISSMEPSEVHIRTSVSTQKYDEDFARKIFEETGIEPKFFGPIVGKSLLNEDLDSLPLPAWELFPTYNLGALSRNKRYLPIQGSVGCPYNCDYCPYPVAQGTKFRPRSPENIVKEMRHFKDTLGVNFFLFRDPVFTLNRKAVIELCKMLKGDGIQWRCETRADLVDEELLQKMAEAGCLGINFGVESLKEESLALVNRKIIEQEKIKAVVAKCKELGIEAFVFYIVGLPGETKESFLQTLEFAKELDTPFVQFLPIIPYPGTAVEEWGRERSFIIGELSSFPHFGTEPIMRNEALSLDEINQLCEIAYRQLEISKGAVVLAKCTDYAEIESAMAKVIANMGGMGNFVKPGDRVLIKPNLIGSYAPEKAATTHPAVVRAIVELVKEAGGIPIIGDSPGGAELASYKNYQRLQEITGILNVSQETGAELVDFSKNCVVTVPIDGGRIKKLTISKVVLDADVVISLPKAKTHSFTYFTGAIKNLYGVVPGLKKAEYHKLAPSQQEFAELLNDIHDYLRHKVKLIVMDGVVGMEGNGPTNGQAKVGNFLIGGADSLTVDIAVCALLGLDYKQSPPLTEALRRRGEENIKINVFGDNINEINAKPFKEPFYQSQDSFIEMYGSIQPQIDGEKCKRCRNCIKSCPKEAISEDFVIDFDKCIKCLCCFEMCEHDAVKLVKASVEGLSLPVARSEIPPSPPFPKGGRGDLRILVISNLYPPHFVGGYELACKEITDRLKVRGHEVMVLTSMFGLESPMSEDGIKRIMDHSYGSLDALSVVDLPLSAYNEYVVRSEITQFQPDVIYLWNFHGLSMQSVMQTILASGLPYVFHAMDYHLLPGTLPEEQEASARSFLSNEKCQTIVMSKTVQKKFLQSGHAKTHLVYHGVEVLPQKELKRKDGFKLLHAGQIRRGKGVHVLLAALQKVKEACPEVSLDIFGGGDKEYESALRGMVERNDLPVIFYGPLKREELLKKYADYDAFVFPTLREEPFGIVIIEAMSAGLPVIASAAGGPAEVIVDGETGLLFEQENADELAKAIIKLKIEPNLQRRLSENSYRLVREKFDILNTVSKIERILSSSMYKSPMEAKSKSLSAEERLKVVWESPIYGLSGYAQVARNAVLALKKANVLVQIKPIPERSSAELPPSVKDEILRLSQNRIAEGVYVCHHVPTLHDGTDVYEFYRTRNPGHRFYIGSTMFETDRIPQDWVAACNKMDEIWAPTHFNLDTFSRSGVEREKIQVIPFGIEVDKFNPSQTKPLYIPNKRGFRFLSVFEWTKRKGWDVLLKAYLEAFEPKDDVCLILRAYCRNGESVADKITEYLSNLGYELEETPDIVVLGQHIPDELMPSLYAAADAFVLPSRGEGWGMPYMEAMAMELPTIGTRWSGNTEFMNDENSYLIDVEGLIEVDQEQVQSDPFYAGHKWAQPFVESTKRLMRYVFENQREAKQKGEKARQDILNHWTMNHAAEKMANRLQEIDKNSKSLTPAAKSYNLPPVFWHASIFDYSGYAEEARNFAITLYKLGVNIRINQATKPSEKFISELDFETKSALNRLAQTEIAGDWVNVIHIPAYDFKAYPQAIANIGRTMFETDRLPDGWAEKCNRMDEIWVPTDFNLETFARAGVNEDKLVKVPSGINPKLYELNASPLEIPQQHGFTFLSVFQWIYRKGWDVLLKAYIEEFSPDEDVCLVLRTYPINENSDTIVQDIEKLVTEELQRNLEDTPDIIILDTQLKTEQMPQLYAAADAFVLPSRGEGWGRPYMEAMAMGLPTIGTRWSGNTEFMNDDNSYLIDVEELVEVSNQMEISFYRGHKWAEPSVEHLRKLMRHVYENQNEAKAKGKRARQDIIENYSWEKVSEIIVQRLGKFAQKKAELGDKIAKRAFRLPQAPPLQQMTILWEGSQFVNHSMALVNRELCIALAKSERCELSIIPYERHQFGVEADPERFDLIAARLNKPLERTADFHIRHQWPPKFEPPEEGHWVLMQPWEYGSMPKDWLPYLRDQIDEVWVYTNYNRDCYIEEGLAPDKVAVIPLSVDHACFHPDASPLPLIAQFTDKSFKFLFVGGTIWRKGIDVLLNAYTQAFTREDDVCLVIKDMCKNSFYAGQTLAKKIQEIQSHPNVPEIVYLDELLPQGDMPKLYATCDCLVHPYRGEGFCLPVAEAMACGLPVIVTKGGATDDFCTDDTVYFLESKRVHVKEVIFDGTPTETVNQAWALEPDLNALIAHMRHVVANPEEAQACGLRASEHIRQTLSWEKSAELILKRLAVLKAKPILRNKATDLAVSKPAQSLQTNAVEQRKLDEGEMPTSDEFSTTSPQDGADMVATEKAPLNKAEMRAQQYLKIAEQYKELSELERALTNYKRALDVKPDCLEALKAFGTTLLEMGQADEAIEIFQKAAEVVPNSAEIHNELGGCFYQTGQVEQAKAAFQKAIEMDSSNAQAYSNMGVLCWKAGDADAAIENLNKALDCDGDNLDALANLGLICYQVGMYQKAIELFKRFLARNPQDAQIHSYLNDCYSQIGAL